MGSDIVYETDCEPLRRPCGRPAFAKSRGDNGRGGQGVSSPGSRGSCGHGDSAPPGVAPCRLSMWPWWPEAEIRGLAEHSGAGSSCPLLSWFPALG